MKKTVKVQRYPIHTKNVTFCFINSTLGTSLTVPWLRRHLPMQQVWIQSLVGELRSHRLCGQKIKNKQTNMKQKQYCNKFKTLKWSSFLKKKYYFILTIFLCHLQLFLLFSLTSQSSLFHLLCCFTVYLIIQVYSRQLLKQPTMYYVSLSPYSCIASSQISCD